MHRIRLILIVAIAAALITLLAGAALMHGGQSNSAAAATASAASPEDTPPPPPPPPGKEARDRDRDRDEGPGRQGAARVPPMFRDITDEDVAKIMAFVGENLPWMKSELEKMRDSDPVRFRQECRHLRFDITQLERLKAADPDAFKGAIEERRLRYEARELAVKVRAATDPKDRDALTAQLRKSDRKPAGKPAEGTQGTRDPAAGDCEQARRRYAERETRKPLLARRSATAVPAARSQEVACTIRGAGAPPVPCAAKPMLPEPATPASPGP
jgi:hypothetical protein